MIKLIHYPRYCYYLIVFTLVAIAIVLQSARLLAPSIDDLRPSVEEYLSSKMNLEVSIGRASAQWYGLRPHLLVNDIRVVNDNHDTLLEVGAADLILDFSDTILNFQWSWKQVAIEDVYLQAHQKNNNIWSIGGVDNTFDRVSDQGSGIFSNLLKQFPQMELQNTEIHWILNNQRSLSTRFPLIKLENRDDFHRLSATLEINKKEAASLVIEKQSHNEMNGFLQVRDFSIEPVVDFLGVIPDEIGIKNYIQSSLFNGTAWFDATVDNTTHVVAQVNAANDSSVTPFSMSLVGDIDNSRQWHLGLRDIVIDKTLSLHPVLVEASHDAVKEPVITFSTETISLEPLILWAQKKIITSLKVNEKLEALSITGGLNHAVFTVPSDDWRSSNFTAYADNISLQPVNNIPGFNHINGFLFSDIDSGFINLSSEQFSLHPEKVYQQPLVFDRIKAQVAWTLDKDNNRIVVNSNHISSESVYGKANGYFSVDLPWMPNSRPADFYLLLGLQNASFENYQKLIPERVPQKLIQWLDKSIDEATVSNAGFIYRGGFSGGENIRSVQLFVDVNNASLNYSDDWPTLSAVDAEVLIDNQYLNISTKTAQVYGHPIDQLTVVWPDDGQRALDISINTPFPASTGLRVLNESWLRSKVGNTFESWRATGMLGLNINLNIPFSSEDANNISLAKTRQSVVISFNNNNIDLPNQRLSLTNTQGKLRYSQDKGLFSQNLKTQLFNQWLPLAVEQGALFGSSQEALMIRGTSKADVKPIFEWLNIQALPEITGLISYGVNLTIPTEKQPASALATITITSDMKDITSTLPAPFRKDSGVFYPLTVTGEIYTNYSDYSVEFGDVSQLAENKKAIVNLPLVADFRKGADAFVGEVWLNSQPPVIQHQLSKRNMITLKGNIPSLSIDQWLSYVNRHKSNRSVNAETVDLSYDLSIGQASFKQSNFNDLEISGRYQQSQWVVNITDDWLEGSLAFDDAFAEPIEVDIDYMALGVDTPLAKVKDEAALNQDPLAAMDLNLIKPASVSIKRLDYQQSNLGAWSFVVEPMNNGVKVDNIKGQFGDLTLSDGQKNGATLTWMKGLMNGAINSHTSFKGVFSGGDVSDVFTSMKIPPLLTSRSTTVDADLRWQGSPALFGVENFQGTLAVGMDKGIFVQENNTTATGILRLLGLFNFNTWARRLKFDFSDVYKKGIAFDSLKGKFSFDQGNIYFQEPLIVKSPSSEFTMAGQIDYPNETIDAVLVTTLPVSGNLTFAAAFVAGFPAAAGVYIISKVFKPQVDKVSSLTYGVKGEWANPDVKFLSIFNNNLTQGEEASAAAPNQDSSQLNGGNEN